jgi:hypothetical protein
MAEIAESCRLGSPDMATTQEEAQEGSEVASWTQSISHAPFKIAMTQKCVLAESF